MTFDLRSVDLDKLNSLTKYPSIPTYHALDPANGNLLEEPPTWPGEGRILATEKIDGTNGRIIVAHDGYVIGSREELLFAKGDLLGNKSMGIVEALRPVADHLDPARENELNVYFFEIYGHKVGAAAKQYTGTGRVGALLFDIAIIGSVEDLLKMPIEQISGWRDHGEQTFCTETALQQVVELQPLGLATPLVPRLAEFSRSQLPTSIEAMLDFLGNVINRTRAPLDDLALGRPEGVVFRNHDRSVIRKARFEDYVRTLHRRKVATARAAG